MADSHGSSVVFLILSKNQQVPITIPDCLVSLLKNAPDNISHEDWLYFIDKSGTSSLSNAYISSEKAANEVFDLFCDKLDDKDQLTELLINVFTIYFRKAKKYMKSKKGFPGIFKH